MAGYVLRRSLQAAFSIVGVLILAFVLARSAGDPVYLLLPPTASEAEVVSLRQALGLDRPIGVQLLVYMANVVRGDWGESLYFREPVFEVILSRVPATLELTFTAFAVALLVAIPLGILAAVRRNGFLDFAATVLAVSGQALPLFWVGLVLIVVFAVNIPLFPVSGRGTVLHLVLPSVTLGIYLSAHIMRLTRSEMLNTLSQDYIRTAHAKGVRNGRVIGVHALKNALTPVISAIGLSFGRTLGGTVITETVFSWPGLGRLVVDAVRSYDYPLIQGCVVILAVFIVVANLLSDLGVAALDPRIRYS